MGADVYFSGFERVQNKLVKKYGLKNSYDLSSLSNSDAKAFYNEMETNAYDKFYFRDSYNKSNLLWQFGLSWWDDIGKMLNDKCQMSLTNMKKFRKMVANGVLKTTNTEEVKYFEEKRTELLRLLDDAIKTKKSPRFSI